MADEGTPAPESGSEDAEASGMLAEAVQEDDGSQGDGEQIDPAVKAKLDRLERDGAKYRKRIRELEPLADEAQKLRDSQKSELEKLTEQLQAAQAESASATAAQLRIDVALEKAPDGMSKAQIRKLAKRLTGSNREELEEDAEELFAEFAPVNDSDGGSNGAQRPRESLGKVPLPNSDKIQLDDETDPRKLAARHLLSPF
jgi:hypothetical protein